MATKDRDSTAGLRRSTRFHARMGRKAGGAAEMVKVPESTKRIIYGQIAKLREAKARTAAVLAEIEEI